MPLAQSLSQVRRNVDMSLDIEVRIGFRKGYQETRKPRVNNRLVGPNAQRSRKGKLVADAGCEFVGQGQSFFGIMQRLMPSPGQANPPAAPLEQRRPEIALEGLDPGRFRGLCRDQPLGSLADSYP